MMQARAAMDANATEPEPTETPASNLVRRVIAFDVGDRRIGVAVSDPLGNAQPLLTLYRKTPRADLKSIGRLLRKHEVAEAVVGNPLNMSGEVDRGRGKRRSSRNNACGVRHPGAPDGRAADDVGGASVAG